MLRQGLTPEKLALSLTLGLVIGCFPVVGVTTVLCAGVALLLRLNLPAIQVGNYLAFPLQFLLMIPFMRLGERIFHSPRLDLSLTQMMALAHHAPEETMRALVLAQWHAIVAWFIVMPFAVGILVLVLRPAMRTLLTAANRRAMILPS